MFRKGLFSTESVAICLLEIIDRKTELLHQIQREESEHCAIRCLHLAHMEEKKLRRAVMRTRRAFKTLCNSRVLHQKVEWSDSVVNQGETKLRGSEKATFTIIERTISESKALRMTDKPTITEYCEKLISKSAELDLSGVHFSTIVDICAMLVSEKQSRNLRQDDMGFSRTPLNWITKARTVLSEVSAIS